MDIGIKEWIYLVGLILTFFTFSLKLNTDRAATKYRETIGFLEKRDEKQNDIWMELKQVSSESTNQHLLPKEKVNAFFSQLELVALLIKRGAFDEEIVYNQWWYFYYQPQQKIGLVTWLMICRDSDKKVFQHYLDLCDKWKHRIEAEQSGI